MLINERLLSFHQLSSWTSVGPSKCPNNKMIGSQNQMTPWTVSWVPLVTTKEIFYRWFFRNEKISKLGIAKKFIVL